MSKSPSLRRIKADIRELSVDPSDQYHAAPLEHDMFEWHFTIRGAPGTDFEGGVYHGRILLPPEYPFKPPDIIFLTPSGRFECGVKVCLSFSAHHPELWQPAWGIRLILEALISFLPTPADGAIGALDWTSEERKKLAKESVKFRCPVCCDAGEVCADLLPELEEKDEGLKKKTKFQEEIEKLKMLQFQNHAAEETEMQEGKKDNSSESKPAEGGVEEQKKESDQPNNDEAILAAKPRPDLLQESDPEPPEKKAAIVSLQGAATTVQPNNSAPDGANQQGVTNSSETTIEPRNVLRAPPRVAPAVTPANATPATTTPTATTVGNNNTNNAPIVSDSLLNMLIGFFGVIVVVLLRQTQSLVDELHTEDLGSVLRENSRS